MRREGQSTEAALGLSNPVAGRAERWPFPPGRRATTVPPTTPVTLPLELERFATEAVAHGRYRDVSEVVQAGVSLLQRAEAARIAFERSLDEALAEGVRDGFSTIDDVDREMAEIIEASTRSQT